MKKRGRNLVILACVLVAAVFSACFLDALRNNANDPKADNYKLVETAKEWKAAVRIDIQNDTVETYPAVAINDAGDSYALWVQPVTARDQVFARKYTNGAAQPWGTDTAVVRISTDSFYTGGCHDPKVAMWQNGEAIAAWFREDPSGPQAWNYNNHTEDGVWSYCDSMGGASSGSYESEIQLAVSADKAIAVWQEQPAYMSNVYNSNDNTWGAASTIGGIATSYYLRLAMNPDGKAVAIYNEQATAPDHQFIGGIFDGTAWGTFADIETTALAGYDSGPEVAINKAGQIIAIWSVNDGTKQVLKANHYDGTSWTTKIVPNVYSQFIRVAMNPNANQACIVYTKTGLSAFESLFVSVYGYGSNSWSEGVRIDQLNTMVGMGSQSVAIDGDGNIIVVWVQAMDEMESGEHIYTCRYTAEGGWSDPQQIDGSSAQLSPTYYPVMAVSESGYVTVVWIQDAGMAMTQTWAARYEDIAKK